MNWDTDTVSILLTSLFIFWIASYLLSAEPIPPSINSGHVPFAENGIMEHFTQLDNEKDSTIHIWVYFRDKGTCPEPVEGVSEGQLGQLYPEAFSQDRSEKFLSSRALARRKKRNLGDLITQEDVPVCEDYVSQVVGTGAKLRRKSRWLNAVSVSATSEQLKKISQIPFVLKVEPVRVYKRPLPPRFYRSGDSQTGSFDPPTGGLRLRRESSAERTGSFSPHRNSSGDTLDYGFSKDQITQINCHLAHQAGYTGRGVLILMLDTGYFKDHEAIRKDSIAAEWDFIEWDGNTQNESSHEDSIGQHDHGTVTFSIAGGYAPGHLIGTAFDARFLLAKTEIVDKEVEIEEDNFVAALEWGDSLGADVASSSLGYVDWYTYEQLDGNTAVVTKAIDFAVSRGIVCVTAAGNENLLPWHYIIPPADADSVISVGAVDTAGVIASFSSRGPTFDGRIKPEVCVRGVLTAGASPNDIYGYILDSGTSVSTPLVAGACAVTLSAHPDWTPMMVREALLNTASKASSPDTVYGWGVIDVWKAIHYQPDSIAAAEEVLIPDKIELSQNYPNPFNSVTLIPFRVHKTVPVSLTVFNVLGQQIDVLLNNKIYTAGEYTVKWNGKDFSSGIYFLRLQSGRTVMTRKILLIK